MTTKTSKFNIRTADRAAFDKELKRLASAKCITGKSLRQAEGDEREALQAKYDSIVAEYDKVRQAKAKKFPGRKTYMDFTQAEIDELNLSQTMAGIASLACKRSRYPEQADEVKRQEAKFQAHKAKLQKAAEVKQALKSMTKEELEALMADAK